MTKTIKVLLLGLAVLAVAGLVGRGTLAYFSDTEVSEGNRFAAGTLDLKLNGGDVNVPVAFENIAPGDHGNFTWTLHNAGTLPGNLTIKDIIIRERSATANGFAGDVFDDSADLGSAVHVHLFRDVNGDGIQQLPEDYAIFDDYLANYQGKSYTFRAPLTRAGTAGDTARITLEYWIFPETGNSIQGDSANMDMTFSLEQVHP